MLVLGPGRFSTTNGWPSRSDSIWLISRETISGEFPAGRPTTIRTERYG